MSVVSRLGSACEQLVGMKVLDGNPATPNALPVAGFSLLDTEDFRVMLQIAVSV